MNDLFILTEQAVGSLDVELVDVERAPQGLLRITIDREGGVRIEDCEAVSRQLSRVYEVENIDYSRLEVGSPGVDRPLRRERDFVRFIGQRVELKLREALDGRKVFAGTLLGIVGDEIVDAPEEGESIEQFGIEFEAKPGDMQVLRFVVEEVDRAKLNPVLNFRGKKR